MTEVMTVEETAEFLKLPKSTVYTYAKKGLIPAFKLGKRWRFEKCSIEEWLKEKMNKGS